MINDSPRWSTKVTFEGTNYFVRPVRIIPISRGFCEAETEPHWAAGILTAHLSRSHPKNGRQLRRAVSRCNTWCARRNVETMIARDTISRLHRDKVLAS